MKFPKQLTQVILALGFSASVCAPKAAQAAPIQCYIDNGGSYHVCDVKEVSSNKFILTWQDGEVTAIIEHRSPSGLWYEVAHARQNGDIYAGGTRYAHSHYHQQGEWTCFHHHPGGRGKIDFCIAAAN